MLLGLILLQQAFRIEVPPNPGCRYDRAALLALPQDKFDQDMRGGWRFLAAQECEGAAADLIRDWRRSHRSKDTLLIWHDGQMRANIGQTKRAIRLFERSYNPESHRQIGWNFYVDGTLAFLRRDRPALEAARETLAALPEPSGFAAYRKSAIFEARWPLNLNVLDGFLRCWDKSYRDAYACAAPMALKADAKR